MFLSSGRSNKRLLPDDVPAFDMSSKAFDIPSASASVKIGSNSRPTSAVSSASIGSAATGPVVGATAPRPPQATTTGRPSSAMSNGSRPSSARVKNNLINQPHTHNNTTPTPQDDEDDYGDDFEPDDDEGSSSSASAKSSRCNSPEPIDAPSSREPTPDPEPPTKTNETPTTDPPTTSQQAPTSSTVMSTRKSSTAVTPPAALGSAATATPHTPSKVSNSGSPARPGSSGGPNFFDEVSHADWIIKWEDLEVEKQLGSGSYGTVHKGRLKHSRDRVAVKTWVVQDNSVLPAFKREVKMLSSLRHEYIVLFRAACLTPPHLCIVTELMTGGNLFDLLASNKPIPWNLRLRWMRDVARGMNYLHTLSPPVIHRDLKSPNILINDYNMIKLCDFGLSRTKQHTTRMTTTTTSGIGGSPPWLAPEVLRGDSFSEASDVYSFGVVMWEVLTRQVPWDDKEFVQLVGLVGFRNVQLPIPDNIAPEVPPDFIPLMKSCWSSEPENRPSFQEIQPICEQMATQL